MKNILAALSLAALSTTAFAVETQFTVPAGQNTRAEVQAQIGQAGRAIQLGEATNFAIPETQRTRAQVGAELNASGTGSESSRTRMAGDARLYVGG